MEEDYQDYPDYSDYPMPADDYEERPKRRRRRKKRRGWGCLGVVFYLVAVFAISVGLSIVAIFSANDVFALVKDNTEHSFVV